MIDAGSPNNFKPICPVENDIEVHRSKPGFNEEIAADIMIAFGEHQGMHIEGREVIPALQDLVYLIERIVGIFERSCPELRQATSETSPAAAGGE